MILYGYWRSSAAYRVRIALNLKGLEYEQRQVHLVRDGGEQHSEDYRRLNPAGLVPVLVDGELTLHQSLAILDHLEQRYPDVPLLPSDPAARALAFAIAADIACDVHPLQNLRVLQYLAGTLGASEEARLGWARHWIEVGFTALERRLAGSGDPFCVGQGPTWADICLVAQAYNARRYGVDLAAFPTLDEVIGRCEALDAFRRAAPENQPDAA